jgi:hypothetical protein
VAGAGGGQGRKGYPAPPHPEISDGALSRRTEVALAADSRLGPAAIRRLCRSQRVA